MRSLAWSRAARRRRRRSTASTKPTSSSRSTRTSSALALGRCVIRRISLTPPHWHAHRTSSTGCTPSSRCPTITGAKADHRLAAQGARRSRRSRRRLPRAVGVAGAGGGRRFRARHAKWVPAIAADLQAHRGRSVVVAGDKQPAAVHALARAMNEALGNVGTTVVLPATARGDAAGRRGVDLRAGRRHERGQGGRARHHRRQSRLHAPANLNFAKALDKVDDALPSRSLSRRDRGAVPLARARGALPRVVGRRRARSTARSR